MNGCISVINSGSSSIKFSLYDQLEDEEMRLLFSGQIEGIGSSPQFSAKDNEGEIIGEHHWENSPACSHSMLLEFLIGWIREQRQRRDLQLTGVGHRVVHGGDKFSKPVLVDEELLTALMRFIPLAPLHQPHNLETIRAIMKLGPEIPQVACFDTSFHTSNPAYAKRFALPRRLHDEGIRRYGFHGLSYEYISRKFRAISPDDASGRVIAAHLGSGASMCAMKDGVSIDSTMGFSAMDGLVMGTRPGSLDPGVILYLLDEKGFRIEELNDLLYRQSGLLGMSEISNDMRILQESDEPQAEEAIAVFLYRIQRDIGSLAAVLGGLDALVFTAGIGENSASIRRKVCRSAQWLGLEIDEKANIDGKLQISRKDSKVSVWVIPTDEELMIATHTRKILMG